jgi:hypothetical protein
VAAQTAKRRDRKRGPNKRADGSRRGLCPVVPVPPERQLEYAYLLAMYLGDGHIATNRRTLRLGIYLDPSQPDIIARCAAAMAIVNPFHRVAVQRKPEVTVVRAYGICWPTLFPQHGPGHKHDRAIVLEPWQRSLVEQHTSAFVHGLIDSDGSRFDRVVGGKAYPAYEFTNRSADILGLFEWACTLLDVHFTRPSDIDVSIARRADVALLDSLIAPKS